MIRIGIIGAGNNAAGHARYYAKSGRATVAAIADPAGAARGPLCGEIGCRGVAAFRELLDDVDAVVVSSPNFLHRDHAVACAAAGKHVYVEKPMGLSLGEAREIRDAVSDAGVASAVGFSVRLAGNVRAMLRRVREGDVGTLIGVRSIRSMKFPDETFDGWRGDPAKSGGVLMEINLHELDWIALIGAEAEAGGHGGGRVSRVFARRAAGADHPRANDHAWLLFDYEHGGHGTHEASWRCPDMSFHRGVWGTEAGLHTGEWGNDLHRRDPAGTAAVEPDEPFDLRGHWLDRIEGRADDARCGVDWGLKVMSIAEAAVRSFTSGVPEAVEPTP